MALEKLATLNFYAPRFEVEIEGKKIPINISKIIRDVRVEEAKDMASRFVLTASIEYDREKGGFKWLGEDSFFKEGKRLSVKMGYGTNLHTMISGRIDEIEASFFSGDAPTLTISGFDLSCELRKPSAAEPFPNMSYSEIVRKIAEEKGFRNPVINPTDKLTGVITKENNISYYQFIKRLAEEIYYEFGINRDNKLYFIRSRSDRDAIVTLEWEKDLISFNPRMRLSELVTDVEVRRHNPQDPASPIVERAPTGDEQIQERGARTGSQIARDLCPEARKVVTINEDTSETQARTRAKTIALSILNRESDTLFTGRGECIGIPQIKPLVTINIEKVGDRFRGKYYVISTTHTINDSGYRMTFEVTRKAG